MTDMTFEQVLNAALTLRPDQKRALVSALQATATQTNNPIREQLITELEALRESGAFNRVESLRNQYRAAALEYVSDQQLLSAIYESASEWENTLRENAGNGD